MHRLMTMMVLLIIISCAHFNKKNDRIKHIEGIVFIEDIEEEKSEKISKSNRESSDRKSNENKKENTEELRNFEAMDGIILLNLLLQYTCQPSLLIPHIQ